MSIAVSDHLYKKKVVKDMSGNIIDLYDETDGGWIIRKRQVVNPEKFAELQKKEADRIEAAKAQAYAIQNPQASEARNAPAGKMQELETRIDGMDDKLDAILKALNK